jgi:hypothetical protein
VTITLLWVGTVIFRRRHPPIELVEGSLVGATTIADHLAAAVRCKSGSLNSQKMEVAGWDHLANDG